MIMVMGTSNQKKQAMVTGIVRRGGPGNYMRRRSNKGGGGRYGSGIRKDGSSAPVMASPSGGRAEELVQALCHALNNKVLGP